MGGVVQKSKTEEIMSLPGIRSAVLAREIGSMTSWLVDNGYRQEEDRADAKRPVRYWRILRDGFQLEVRSKANTTYDAGTGDDTVLDLKKIHVRIRYDKVVRSWTLNPWPGVELAKTFIQTCEGRALKSIEKLVPRVCPKCVKKIREAEDEADGVAKRLAKGLMEKRFASDSHGYDADPYLQCDNRLCGFKWGRRENPTPAITEGLVRIQHDHDCPRDGQTLVWWTGTRSMTCSMSPYCDYRKDASAVMARRLMEEVSTDEDLELPT